MSTTPVFSGSPAVRAGDIGLACRILHVFPTFEQGGAQVRVAKLMKQFGAEVQHGLLALDGEFGAMAQVDPSLTVRPIAAPLSKSTVQAVPGLANLLRVQRPDLLLTYNWGAMDAVMAGRLARVCPVIHTEDGFGPDEAVRLKLRRVWTRRLLLPGLYRTVVPSSTLLRIARQQYRLKDRQVQFIPNGVDTRWFTPGQDSRLRTRLGIPRDAFVLGSVARLRPEKNLGLLLRAFAAAQLPKAHLIIAGDGPCRGEWQCLAQQLGIWQQVHFPGMLPDPGVLYRAADLFVMSSCTEQMPVSLLEAMASGLPVLTTDVGDCRPMLGAGPQSPQVTPAGEEGHYCRALQHMAASPELAQALGAQNRERCVNLYSQDAMFAAHAALYRAAILSGRSSRS